MVAVAISYKLKNLSLKLSGFEEAEVIRRILVYGSIWPCQRWLLQGMCE